MHRQALVALLATTTLTGCPDRTISGVNPEQTRVEYKDIPINANRNVDLLFVVDDSGSMGDKQQNLKANFSNFINVLETIEGGLPDLHIGVVSSDIGVRGSEDAVGTANGPTGCAQGGKGGALQKGLAGAELRGNYLSDVRDAAGVRVKNYDGDLATVFGQMASLGVAGCGFEGHLQAMQLALDDHPQNTGFLRDDAYLAVIFIADEDDCSFRRGADLFNPATGTLGPLQSFRCTRFGVTCDVGGTTPAEMNALGPKGRCYPNERSTLLASVDAYVAFLKRLKPGAEENVLVAGIMGNPEPVQVDLRAPRPGEPAIPSLGRSCTYTGAPTPMNTTGLQVADPSTRLSYFLGQFGGRSTFTTICQPDLSDGLTQIGNFVVENLPNRCIAQLADADDETPGPQYDCSVSWKAEGVPERILAACDASSSNAPCWRIEVNATECVAGDHLKLVVDRGLAAPPPDTHEIAYCVIDG